MTTRTTARELETRLITTVNNYHTTKYAIGRMTFTTIEDAKAFCKKYKMNEERIVEIK